MEYPQEFTHISLFSGIGGFDLAAEQLGWINVAHCEWNSFGQYVLKDKWNNSKSHHDITKTDFSIYRGRINIVTGGFPCQPYSNAGKRKGKEDERHLWPEMLRAIREIAPPWVVGENVRGLINWNAGLVFNEVQADLEAEGYEVLPFLLPAAGVNAPHERYRVWFIAFNSKFTANGRYNSGEGSGVGMDMERIILEKAERLQSTDNIKSSGIDVAYSTSERARGVRNQGGEKRTRDSNELLRECSRLYGNTGITPNTNGSGLWGKSNRPGNTGQFNQNSTTNYWENFPTQPPVCNGDDGFPTDTLRQRIREDSLGVISEKEIDKILSKAAKEWYSETIKAGGNAIVPQVFIQIGKAINEYVKLNKI